MKRRNKMKIIIFILITIAAFSITASAQVEDKHVAVNLKENQTKIYKAETVRSVDFYRIKGKKGQKVIFEVTSKDKNAVFQINLIKAGSKQTDEPLGIAFDQTRYEYTFYTNGDAVEVVVGAKRGAGTSYTLKVTLAAKNEK